MSSIWTPDGEHEVPREQSSQSQPGAEETQLPIPPASLEFLVMSLMTQTQIHLGLLRFGDEPDAADPKPNLPMARHFIDMLSMLQEKTRGNLTHEESLQLENALTELRFRYVAAAEAKPQR